MRIYKRPPNHHTNKDVMMFGLCEILDGVIRVFSFGYLFSSAPLDRSRKQAEKMIKKRIKQRNESK